MRIFLDTNVLLDYVQAERPNNEIAKILFELISKNHLEPYVSTQSVIDMVYVLSKIDKVKTMVFVNYLLNNANVRPIDCFSLRIALNSGHPDFEDSAQLACAEDEECDVFLTSDAGILAREVDTMLVMTPGQFLDRMR